jgi:hypothetical protein
MNMIIIGIILIIIVSIIIGVYEFTVVTKICPVDKDGNTVISEACKCGDETCDKSKYCYKDSDDEFICDVKAKDLCKDNKCGENGTCSDGKCTCNEGWEHTDLSDPTSPCSKQLTPCDNDDCNGRAKDPDSIKGYKEKKSCDCGINNCEDGFGGNSCQNELPLDLSHSDCVSIQRCTKDDEKKWRCISNSYLNKSKSDCVQCPNGTTMKIKNGLLSDCIPNDEHKYLEIKDGVDPQMKDCKNGYYRKCSEREDDRPCKGNEDDCIPDPKQGYYLDQTNNELIKCKDPEKQKFDETSGKCVCDISKGYMTNPDTSGNKCIQDERCEQKKCGVFNKTDVEYVKKNGFQMLLTDDMKNINSSKLVEFQSKVKCDTLSEGDAICKLNDIKCDPTSENKLNDTCTGCSEDGMVLIIKNHEYQCVKNPCYTSDDTNKLFTGLGCFDESSKQQFVKGGDGTIYTYKITGDVEPTKITDDKVKNILKGVCPNDFKCELSNDKHELKNLSGDDSKYFNLGIDSDTQQKKISCLIPEENRLVKDGNKICTPRNKCTIMDSDGKFKNYCEGVPEGQIEKNKGGSDEAGCLINSDGLPSCKCKTGWTHDFNSDPPTRKCSIKRTCPDNATPNPEWDDGEAHAWLDKKHPDNDKITMREMYYPDKLATVKDGKFFNAYVKNGKPIYKCLPSSETKNPFTGGKCEWWQYQNTSDNKCYKFHEISCSYNDFDKSVGHYYDLRGNPKCSFSGNGGKATSGTMKNNECCKSCGDKYSSSFQSDDYESDQFKYEKLTDGITFESLSSENKSITGPDVPLQIAKSPKGDEKWTGTGYNSYDTYYQRIKDPSKSSSQKTFLKTTNDALMSSGDAKNGDVSLDPDVVSQIVKNMSVCTKVNPPKSEDDSGVNMDDNETLYFDPSFSSSLVWRKPGVIYGATCSASGQWIEDYSEGNKASTVPASCRAKKIRKGGEKPVEQSCSYSSGREYHSWPKSNRINWTCRNP